MAEQSKSKIIGSPQNNQTFTYVPNENIAQSLATLGVFANRSVADRCMHGSREFIRAFYSLISTGGNFENCMYFIDMFTRTIAIIEERYNSIPEINAERRHSI
jgi:hypothetical protein